MKKLLSLILAVLTLIPAAVFVSADGGYGDVDPKGWSAASIAYVTEKGYMNGTSAGKFSPGGTMTRAMVVTVLWRMDGAEAQTGDCPFSDVPAGTWYSDAVVWAAENGVVNGTAPDRFSPDGKITREQLAAMMYRYSSMKKLDVVPDGDLKAFSDEGQISAWAKEPLSWAVGAELIRGVTADTVKPGGNATREQFAAILERFDKAAIPTFRDVYLPIREQIADRTEEMLRAALKGWETDPEEDRLYSWKNGLLLIGLWDAGRHDVCAEYVDALIEYGVEPSAPDSGLVGYVVCCLYEETKDEKYAAEANRVLADFVDWPTDKEGEIKYDDSLDHQDIYVDGTGMATPFIAKYVSAFGDVKVKDFAAPGTFWYNQFVTIPGGDGATLSEVSELQVDNYLKYGVDKKRGMVSHGYSDCYSTKGEWGWGRGTGWLMLAVGTVVRYCADEETLDKCDWFFEKTFARMKPEGKFGWTLQYLNDDSDTSATGMILWGTLQAMLAGRAGSVSDGTLRRIARANLSDVKDGVVYGSSGESGGWYSYSDNHNENNEWGQGPILSMYSLMLDKFSDRRREDFANRLRPVNEQIADFTADMLGKELVYKETDPDYSLTGSLNGTMVFGLCEAGRTDDLKNYIDAWIESGEDFGMSEIGLVGFGVEELYEKTHDEKYAALCRRILEGFVDWPTTVHGEIKYDSDAESTDVYVDGTGMVTPFIARYSALFGDLSVKDLTTDGNTFWYRRFGGDMKLSEIARLQISNYFKYGVNPVTKLAFHGYSGNGLGAGEPGWGRGEGWLLLAIGSVMKYCPEEELCKKCEQFITKTFTYLLPCDMFAWSLSEKNGASDTSATGMILWGTIKAKEAGFCGSIGDGLLERIANACLNDVRDGAVWGGTVVSGGFGSYGTENTENNGYCQGAVLAFLSALINMYDN